MSNTNDTEYVVWKYNKGWKKYITATSQYYRLSGHMILLGIYGKFKDAQKAHPNAK